MHLGDANFNTSMRCRTQNMTFEITGNYALLTTTRVWFADFYQIKTTDDGSVEASETHLYVEF